MHPHHSSPEVLRPLQTSFRRTPPTAGHGGDSTTHLRWRFGLQHLMLCASMVILIFSNDAANARLFQIAGVACLTASAILFLLLTPARKIHLSFFDFLIFSMITLSYSASIFSQEMYVLLYTTIFLTAYLSTLIVSRYTTHQELLHCLSISIVVIIFLVLALYSQVLLSTLMPGASRRWELRWAPFDMHPNLAGFIYGGFMIIIANSRLTFWHQRLPIKLLIIGLLLAIILAASARGGLLAAILVLLVYISAEMIQGRIYARHIYLFVCICVCIAVVRSEQIIAYVWEMLDLGSSSRGIDSGGTGRVQIWQHGLDYITGRGWEIFIGSGLRSASPDNVGTPTESSYINIAIESGVPFVMLFGGYLIVLLVGAFKKRYEPDGFYRLVFYTLLFAVLQSVVNRYLIAIGNPFSLFVLIIASKASLGVNIRR